MDFRRSTYALAVFLTTLLGATPAGAKMVKLDVDLKASEITATVDQPLARMQGSVSGTFRSSRPRLRAIQPILPAPVTSISSSMQRPTARATTHRDNAVLSDALETRLYSVIKFVSTRIEDLKWDQQGVERKRDDRRQSQAARDDPRDRVPVTAFYATDGSFSADGDYQFDCTEFGIRPPRRTLRHAAGGKDG